MDGEKKRTLEEIDAEIAAVEGEMDDVRGTECEVYTRIVGYYRALRNWNKGKQEEYGLRKLFAENPQKASSRLEQAIEREKASRAPVKCRHPELAWKCPNSKEEYCTNIGNSCFIDALMSGAKEQVACGNETAPMAHVEKEATA